MRRNLRRIGLVLAICICLIAVALDIYLDKHPEELKKFMAEHPTFFPMDPWQAYGAAAIATVVIAIAVAVVLRSIRKRSRQQHNDY